MSDVKMCDNCGDLFSVNEKGWRGFTETWNGDPDTRDQFNNPHNHNAMTRHMGPCCNLTGGGVVRPRVAMTELPSGRITSNPEDVRIQDV